MKVYQKVLLAVSLLLLTIPTAKAQVTANVCTQTTMANGGNNCIPVSASNPFPIAVFGGSSGQCFVSNGVKGTFTTCPGGSSISLTTTGTSGPAVLTGSSLNIPVYSGGGGSGTVTSITSGTANVVVTPTSLTTTGTIGLTNTITAQGSTTSYTITPGNMGQTVTNSSSSAIAITLPTSGATGFSSGSSYSELSLGTGALTITTSSGTINGNATQILHQYGWAFPISDGSNWQALVFPGFGTITPNALTKYIDVSGATTASGLIDTGTQITTSENMALSSTVTVTNLSVTGTCTGCGGGGSGNPGGSALQVQYQINGTTFGGATNLFYSSTSGGLNFANTTTGNALSQQASGTDKTSIAVGPAAGLIQTSTGSNNVAIGLNALTTGLGGTGTHNTAVGAASFKNGGNASDNTGLGYNTCPNQLGVGNTCIGSQAGAGESNTSNNTFVGSSSGVLNTGGNNTAVGTLALGGTGASGSNNTALGVSAAQSGLTGSANIIIGYQAAFNKLSSGSNNTIIGETAGTTTLTTGSNNILLGGLADTTTSGASHEFHLHDPALAAGTDAVTITGMGTNSTEAATINGSLNVTATLTHNGATVIDTAGTGLIKSSTTLSQATTGGTGSGAEQTIDFQPGILTSVTATKGVFGKFVKSSTVDNIVGSAYLFSCVSNPTITLFECGTDSACATTPATIGTVTVTTAGVAVDGTVSNAAITAGDYIAWAITAGTCTSLDISATAQVHAN